LLTRDIKAWLNVFKQWKHEFYFKVFDIFYYTVRIVFKLDLKL